MRPRTPGNVVEILALTLAAVIMIGLAFGYQLVVLTTSSMAPFAPAGSLLIVTSQSPEDVVINDVIVMQRDESVLVTHRVVGIESQPQPAPSSGAPQILATTKGDANQTPDPNRYELEADQRVVQLVIPHAGWLILPIVDRTFLVFGLAALVGMALLFVGNFQSRRGEESELVGPKLLSSGLEERQDQDHVNRRRSALDVGAHLKP